MGRIACPGELSSLLSGLATVFHRILPDDTGRKKALKPFRFKGFWDFIGCLGVAKWRRGWDSNPRTSSSPVTRFRVERVTAASLPLRPAKDFSGSWHKEQEGVNPNPLSSLLEGELLHIGPQRNPFLLEWPLIVSGHDNFIFS